MWPGVPRSGGGAYPILASTEILHEGGDSWAEVGSLPQALIGLKAVSINNEIIATGDMSNECMVTDPGIGTGGQCCWDDEDWAPDTATSAAVYRFDPVWQEWAQVGEMQQPRSYHGMGVVSGADMQH